MADVICGRNNYLDKIRAYAESINVGNQAFLGLKGVGKTALFQSYFTRKQRAYLAEQYKKLFVFSQLDSRKQGTDLYKFLLDQVKIGILSIPDKNVQQEIKSEMDIIDGIFETHDGRLTQYLTIIKDFGFDLIIIMDQFHCMARDTEIGKEQYDVLRSFNEQKLITYWIITDTDLMETCATKQYVASFFAQKFTSKLTIGLLEDCECDNVADYFINLKKIKIHDETKGIVKNVSGNIPELVNILLDIAYNMENEGKNVDEQSLIETAVAHIGCISLFENWISGLNIVQKTILFDVANTVNGLDKYNLSITESKMAELADDVGRGLLHVIKELNTKRWVIISDLFKNYILSKGELFCNEKIENEVGVDVKTVENHITNNYYVEGNLIQSQTNNILSIENAISGLEDLQRLVMGNSILLDESQAMGKLDYLPFRQEAWVEMNAEEQEEELQRYADGIFESEIFTNGLLTAEQMTKFNLNEKLLGNLSDSCRTQIICGIQVYNLIQLCIDNFGLSMSESESPRGILFARAFERHLKDYMAPSICRIPELASKNVYPTQKSFREYPLEKTTIGTYSAFLKYGHRIYSQASVQLLGKTELDVLWWGQLADRLTTAGDLRNECCHSGTTFDNGKLGKLIDIVFKQNSLTDVLVFENIPTLRRNQFSLHTEPATSTSVLYQFPDMNLIGCNVTFKVISKTARGNLKGTVNEIYEGSLPKRYADILDFNSIKNTCISVTVEKVQDCKYVLSILT